MMKIWQKVIKSNIEFIMWTCYLKWSYFTITNAQVLTTQDWCKVQVVLRNFELLFLFFDFFNSALNLWYVLQAKVSRISEYNKNRKVFLNFGTSLIHRYTYCQTNKMIEDNISKIVHLVVTRWKSISLHY